MTDRRIMDDRSDFPDVGNKNFRVIDVYLREHFPDTASEIQRSLLAGVDPAWTYDRLKGQWVPLGVFGVVLDNLIHVLGNPKKLQYLAYEAAITSDFGGMRLLVDTISYFFRFVTSPQFFFRVIVPQLVDMFNLNKYIEAAEDSYQHVVHRIVYRADPATGRRLRQPIQDMDSLLWFMPGVTASSARLWRVNPEVFRRVTELDLPATLTRYRAFIQENVVVRVDGIWIGEERVAEPIFLRAERGEGRATYFTRPTARAGAGRKRGYRILATVDVHTPDSEPWRFLEKGEIYSAAAGCSLIEYRFRPTSVLRPVFRFWSWLVERGPITRMIQDSVKARVAEMRYQARIEHMHAALEEANMVRRRSNRLRFLPGMEQAAEQGKVQTVADRSSTILLYDIAQFTEFCAGLKSAKDVVRYLRPFQERVDQSLLPYSADAADPDLQDRIFATFPNDTGDGGIIALHGRNAKERLRVALRLAALFHKALQEIDFGPFRIWLRCGIAGTGEVVHWSTKVIPSRIMKVGTSINLAKRLETAGKLPGLRRSSHAPYRGVTILSADEAETLRDEAVFHIPDHMYDLPGFRESFRLARFERFIEEGEAT